MLYPLICTAELFVFSPWCAAEQFGCSSRAACCRASDMRGKGCNTVSNLCILSLNNSLLLIDVEMMCPVCGKLVGGFFPSPCSRASVFLNYMQKTAVQLRISTSTVEQVVQLVGYVEA